MARGRSRLLTDPTPLTFTVDRLPVAGGPDRPLGGWTAPADAGRLKPRRSAAGCSWSSTGLPVAPRSVDSTAPEGATVAAWANGKMLGETPVYGGAWEMPIRASTSGIRFTVDGLPDAGGPYSSSLDGVPYWFTLATPARGTRPRDGARWRITRQRVDRRLEGARAARGADHRHLGRPCRCGANDDPRRRRMVDRRSPVGTFDLHFEVNRSKSTMERHIRGDSPRRRDLPPARLVRSRAWLGKRRSDWCAADQPAPA